MTRGLEPPDAGARHDLLEILEDRYDAVPPSSPVADPTYADAVLEGGRELARPQSAQ
jgi:hypothetical protein